MVLSMELRQTSFLSNPLDANTPDVHRSEHPSVNLSKDLLAIKQHLDTLKTPNYPIDQNMATILFVGDCLADINDFLTTVDDSIIIFDKDTCGFMFIAKKSDIDAFIEKHIADEIGPNGQKKTMGAQHVPEYLIDNIKSVHTDMYDVLLTAPLRDRVNLLYLLCSGIGDQTFAFQPGFDTTIKQFMLKQLSDIEKLNSTKEIEDMIFKLACRFVLAPDIWNTKISQYNKTLGMIKFSNPLFLDVIVSDGQRTNLFDLDKSTEHTIMNGICVSKLKIDYDFSNLCINGNFICTNIKTNITLPKQINGLLNCSYCDFKITHIPIGANTVCLIHTIKNFKDLNQIDFPSSVSKIILSRSLLNRASKDSDELQQIQIFTQKYPNIIIWDEKDSVTLLDILEKSLNISKEKRQQKLKELEPVTIPVKEKQHFEEKTHDWKTRKEILDILSKDVRFANIPNLDRLIKRATNQSNNITERKIHNGQPVLCIHKKNIDIIIKFVLEIIADNELRINEQTTKTNQSTTLNKEQELTENKKTKKTEKQKNKPVHIEKYIPKNVWKNICDSCNDSLNLKIQVLEEINKINIDYTKQKNFGAIQYVDENGQIQVISNVRKKDGNCATQNIGSNRKRIVWTINPVDNIIVAITYLEEHSESIRVAIPYMEARKFAAKCQNLDGIQVTHDLVEKNNYLSVSDLLNEYKSLQTPTKSDNEPMQFPTVTEDIPHLPEEKTLDTQNTLEIATPIVNTTTNGLTDTKPAKKRRRRYTLIDITATETLINEYINKCDSEIAKLSMDLMKQSNNPYEQLNTLKMIKKLIQDKMNYMCK